MRSAIVATVSRTVRLSAVLLFLPHGSVWAADREVVIVGISYDYPPYEFLNASGDPDGFDVELIRAVAATERIPIRFAAATWEEIRADLDSGEVDVLGGMLVSEQRRQEVDFSEPHNKVAYSAFVRENTVSPQTPGEYRGLALIVERDSLAHEELLRRGFQNIVTVISEPEALRALRDGEGDVAFVPNEPAEHIAPRYGFTSLETTGPPLIEVDLAFAVGKENAELLADLNHGLAAVRASGEYQEIYNRWFGREAVVSPAVMRYLLAGVIVFGLAALISLYWNRSLQRKVARQTEALRVELSENKKLARSLEYNATHDSLTGLYNRHTFRKRLNGLLEDNGSNRHVLCYIDLDRFKRINDTCGHLAGDELLRQLGRMFANQVPQDALIARLGGDEFALLIPNTTTDSGEAIARSLLDAILDFRFLWEERVFEIGASIGIVPFGSGRDDLTELLTAADAACYAAKNAGQQRVRVYREDDNQLVRYRDDLEMLDAVARAIQEDRFELVYQPIVSVAHDDGGRRYEVLVRMRRDGERVFPRDFLHIAERHGLSPAIDRWVVQNMVARLRHDSEHVCNLKMCSINLSGLSLNDDEFLETVREEIARLGPIASRVCFEITETAAIANIGRAIGFVHSMKNLGCRFALDDFGSGVSSFINLKRLPVDVLKIDGAFVRGIVDSETDLAIVRAISEIASMMGKQTVAEYVETKEVFEKLRVIGVDYAQGTYVGETRPIDELIKRVA